MDDAVYSAIAVANEFLRKARESRRILGVTQVHELVYCAHGLHLVTAGQALITGPIAAHRGGVFIPELQDAGCWGHEPLRGLLHDVTDETVFPRVETGTPARFTIDRVWLDYGAMSQYDLTRLTLTPRGPWDEIWNGDPLHQSCLIPNRLLSEWFGHVDLHKLAVRQSAPASGHPQAMRTPAF
jgi:uncharacterized phage-associated protein